MGYLIVFMIQCLYNDVVICLVNISNRRVQFHFIPKKVHHLFTYLASTTYKFPFLLEKVSRKEKL